MKETTAEEFLQAIKKAVDLARNVVGITAKAAGAMKPKERQAFEEGVQLVPPCVIRDADGASVSIPLAGQEPDWAKLREMLLKSPEPSRDQRRTSLLSETARQLPHAPGGHPFKLNTQQQRLAAAKRVERYRVKEHMGLAE